MFNPIIREVKRYRFSDDGDKTIVVLEVTACEETRLVEARVNEENEVRLPHFAGYVAENGQRLWPMTVLCRQTPEGWVCDGWKPTYAPRARTSGKGEPTLWADRAPPGLRAQTPWKVEFAGRRSGPSTRA